MKRLSIWERWLLFLIVALGILGLNIAKKISLDKEQKALKKENKVEANDTAKVASNVVDFSPGKQPDEVLVTNISKSCYFTHDRNGLSMFECDNDSDKVLRINFNQIGFKTKRLGGTAYDVDGNVLKHARPVFAKKVEVDSFILLNN